MRKGHIRLLIVVAFLALLAGLIGIIWIPNTITLEPLSQFPDEFPDKTVASEKYYCQPVLIHKPRYVSIKINDVNVLDSESKQPVEGIKVYAYDSYGKKLGPGTGSYSISEFFSDYPSSKNSSTYHVISQETVLFILTPFSLIQQNMKYELIMDYRYLGVVNGTATTLIT